MRLELSFLPQPTRDVAVVVDVLRMTTTASVLFRQGLGDLFVVADLDEARRLAKERNLLLLGERDGVAPEDFDGGNSPREYAGLDLSGRQVVLCTSNGSAAVEAVAGANDVLLGSIVNARAVAQEALRRAADLITLTCAGTNGAFSFDDALAAACIAREVLGLEPQTRPSDSVTLVLKALQATDDLATGLFEADHGRRLLDLGYEGDVTFAANLSSTNVVPYRVSTEPLAFRATSA